MKISYSPESIHDLIRLREFIEVKNPAAAKRIANELLAGIGKLKIFPGMGLPVKRAPDPRIIRDLFIYRSVYGSVSCKQSTYFCFTCVARKRNRERLITNH